MHGFGGRPIPLANCWTRSLLAMSGRADGHRVAIAARDRVLDDLAPSGIRRCTSTGMVPTAFLIARASGRFIPSIRSFGPRAVFPPALEQVGRQLAGEQDVIAQRQHAAGDQAVVGLSQLVDRQVAGRVLRMRKRGCPTTRQWRPRRRPSATGRPGWSLRWYCPVSLPGGARRCIRSR